MHMYRVSDPTRTFCKCTNNKKDGAIRMTFLIAIIIPMILLMEEIVHHRKCLKPCKQWDRLPINWCRISAIDNSNNHYGQSMSTKSSRIFIGDQWTLYLFFLELTQLNFTLDKWCLSKQTGFTTFMSSFLGASIKCFLKGKQKPSFLKPTYLRCRCREIRWF